jgi:hypothetical protein
LELQHLDHRISGGREGVPRCPHPLPLRKQITITAEARGSKSVVVQIEVDGVREPPRKLKVPNSTSTTEAVLTGFEFALQSSDGLLV